MPIPMIVLAILLGVSVYKKAHSAEEHLPHFGFPVVERPQPRQSVPEPASLGILAAGAAVAFLRRRRK
jgi:hypothetical protein